jgi:subtilisin family serine protease
MTTKRVVATLVALSLLLAMPPGGGVAHAQLSQLLCPLFHSKLDAALHDRVHNAAGSARVQTIIRTPQNGLDALLGLIPFLGGTLRTVHRSISALTLETTVGALSTLGALPGVLSMSLDAPLLESRSLAPGDVLANRAALDGTAGSVTHLRETLGLDDRWTGAGVGVAVIDSGLQPQGGFAGRVRYFRDFTGTNSQLQDDFGHGTHVSGLIGGACRSSS